MARFASRPERRAFTLVELLIVISIIGILTGMMLMAMSSATETAKENKTKALIAKLNNLVMGKWDSYRTRRVPLNTLGMAPQYAAAVRLNALHELMRLEMPDRWSDITDGPSLVARPSVSQAYLRAYNILPATPSDTFAQAECLYLLITLGITDELGGRELFNESNVGDTDQDGAKEFVDGWGMPISFLRWCPAFSSELNGAGASVVSGGGTSVVAGPGLSQQNNAYVGKTLTIQSVASPPNANGQSAVIASSSYNSGSGQTTLTLASALATAPTSSDMISIDPDPFDPRHVYPNSSQSPPKPTFAIYPLIYSSGPDKVRGIAADFTPPIHYSTINNNPFTSDGSGLQVGTPMDLTSEQSTPGWQSHGWMDNIHNHLIGTR
jgi:prepilin-type N-terminal cleavage/methylation domain-containing protein